VGTPFDEDTRVTPDGAGRWAAVVSDRWDVAVPNGGYVLCIALAAVRAELGSGAALSPIAVSAHYLGACDHGPASIDVAVLKRGRSLSTAFATLAQGDRTRLAVLATYGDLAASSGPTLVSSAPPSLPPPDACLFIGDRPAGGLDTRPPIADRVDFRPSPASALALVSRGQPARLEGWVRLAEGGRGADGEAMRPEHLPLLVDASPPALFAALETGWVPTVELTVHVRGIPAPGWLTARIETNVLIEGTLEEDCTLWDGRGQVVAMSRQLARALPPPAA
jgi:Thioesterase-like superfamily